MTTSVIIPDFSNIKISTETIIAVSNQTYDLNLLYNYLPITEYVVVQRKRGRKKKTEVIDPNKHVPVGSIISVQNKTNVRGAVIKKKKESKTYFLNSITVILVLEHAKIINVKISKNGKFQITGCKDNSHFLKCVEYIYKHIKQVEEQIGENICTLKNPDEHHLRVIFNIVMKNIDFKIGFSIQRDKLDTFISLNTDFTSHFEGSITTGVNIKLKSRNPYESKLNCLQIIDGETKYSIVDYKDYLSFLDEKEKKKESKKIKYHTFLVFCSGSIIQSGSGPDMESVYKDFMNILLKNRKEFEEQLTEEVN
jgi:TATA-box binding protein (TBP) (component of TFIID and TFIIIB)